MFSQYFMQYGGGYGLENFAIDAAGNLYGTGQQGSWNGFIFKASHGSTGWQSQYLVIFYGNFPASGVLALDAEGNLYGTTTTCGTNGGTVWEASP